MDFYSVVDHAIALLRQRGRVTYRALKRQFDLDDDVLEDLKAELITAQRLAVDEQGAVLVWVGETGTPPALQADVPPLPGASPAPERRPPEAERRQLTVLFCDLVDSTVLAGQLDPEDWRHVVREYQRVCTDVIQRYDGYIAQLLGDGLLVYLGYPHAHDDDAQRAVRAGLGMLVAMGDLNSRLQQAKGIQLGVRLGIHTGLVVVGEMGGAGRQERLALGETPNIAARIQGLAAPNTLVISDATYSLVQGYFACQDLGAQSLRGVTEAMRIYHVLSESGATSRLDVTQPRGLTPLVGRESEVTLLHERWDQAKAGHGHVVLLSAEGGLGKSRLVQTLKDHIVHEPHTRWECRSAEYYQNTALYPLTELWQRTLQWQHDETPDEKLAKLEHVLSQYRLLREESVPLFAPLLSLSLPESRYAPLNLSPQRQRQKTLETLVAILLELAKRQPVLFIVEDLHWTDPTTLEWLNLLIDQIPTTSILTVLTCRPHFQPTWHHHSYITEITLNHLSHAQVEQIVTGMTEGTTLPPEVLQQILAKTDGVPLFVEEITKAILESGQLTAIDGHYELVGSLSTFRIPTTLQDSLMARLDRLVTAKAVAQYAAVIGRQFSYGLLQAVSQLDEAMLQHELGTLVEAEIVYQRGLPPQTTYLFKHALIQDAAYQSLLKSTRQQYHQRIAQVLEAQFPETAETQPELLAHHYTEGGLIEQALPYWQRAGQRAIERSAHAEAIAHLTKGLQLLTTLPDTPERLQRELDLQTHLGPVLIATKGYAAPEVAQTYTRARELCQQMGETPQLFLVLSGLRHFYEVRAELQTARGLGEQLVTMAQKVQDPALLVQAHFALGETLWWLGEFAPARLLQEQGMAFYNPRQHRSQAFLYGQDPGMACRTYAAVALWRLGYPDQALTRMYEALTLAQALSHPFSLAWAFACVAWLHQFRREWPRTQEWAEEAIRLATEQGFPFMGAWGTFWRGWTLAAQGQEVEGIAHMRQGLAIHRATGAELARPYLLALLAEVYGHVGQTGEGLNIVGEALEAVNKTEEREYEAELYRLKGELSLKSQVQGRQSTIEAEAETYFHKAVNIARSQQAKSFELRTATSLARLWQQQGKRDEAQALLAPIYGWFTEGFDTTDLQEAKALLEDLER